MSTNKLHKSAAEAVDAPPVKEVREINLSSEGRLITRIMLGAYSKDPAVVNAAKKLAVTYELKGGNKWIPFKTPDVSEIRELVQHYRRDPKNALGFMRANLIEMARDKQVSEKERRGRLERYLRKTAEAVVMLDQYAFPPDGPNVVHEGFPAYIPDGLSDLGSNRNVNDPSRKREKIRVDKKISYEKAMPALIDAIWALANATNVNAGDTSSSEVKMYLANHIMTNVHQSMPYDHSFENLPKGRRRHGQSMSLDEFVLTAEPVSVCRHIAMETQLRNQLLGLESRLLKCRIQGIPHATVLLRVNNQWYLTDPTSPEPDPSKPGSSRNYMRKIVFEDRADQEWYLDRYETSSQKKPAVYIARNSTYYRVMDNKKDPVR